MHLSISSSNDRLPEGRWLAVWTGVIVVFVLCILFIETKLRFRGWSPSVNDSGELWSYYRERAAELGANAVILAGKSRIQLGVDLGEIRIMLKREPVQLAIDGTSPVPVMAHLARDPRITGTIILELTENDIQRNAPHNKADEWTKYYDDVYIQGINVEPYKVIDRKIRTLLESILVSRIEGAQPYRVITAVLINNMEIVNYLVFNHDRSRDADYQKVKMPDFYDLRVARHFGRKLFEQNVITHEAFIQIYKQAIAQLQPLGNNVFLQGIEKLLENIRTIESRGGRVIIVRFPTGKLIRDIDNKKYPRQLFWDLLAGKHSATIHAEDYHGLSAYDLPDGSHIDFRDKKQFTHELMKIVLKMQAADIKK